MKPFQFSLGFLLVFINGAVFATEPVQPMEGRLGGKAGDTALGSFLITNTLDVETDVSVSVTPLPNPGTYVPLPSGIVLDGSPTFRLEAGKAQPVNYHVTFPTPFDKPAAAALSLVIRRTGDASSSPVLTQTLPIYLQPAGVDAVFKIDLQNPSITFVNASPQDPKKKKLQVALIVLNGGNVPIQPRGRVDFRTGGQSLELLPIQGTGVVVPGGTVVYDGMTSRTDWPDAAYEAVATFDFGDYYGKPQKLEKTYFFRVSGGMISTSPGSALPQKITPR